MTAGHQQQRGDDQRCSAGQREPHGDKSHLKGGASLGTVLDRRQGLLQGDDGARPEEQRQRHRADDQQDRPAADPVTGIDEEVGDERLDRQRDDRVEGALDPLDRAIAAAYRTGDAEHGKGERHQGEEGVVGNGGGIDAQARLPQLARQARNDLPRRPQPHRVIVPRWRSLVFGHRPVTSLQSEKRLAIKRGGGSHPPPARSAR